MTQIPKLKLAVILPYHNNIHDTLVVLKQIGETYMITPRSYRKKTHLPPPIPIQKLSPVSAPPPLYYMYNPVRMYKAIKPGTTHVMIKHIHLPSNLLLAWIARIKKINLVVMVQQVPKKTFLEKLLLRAMLACITTKHTSFFSVTKEGEQALKPLVKHVSYLPAPIDVQRFTKATLHTQTCKNIRILHVGKYQNRKNLEPLINAIIQIKRKYPEMPISLTIAGSVVDTEEYNRLITLVENSSHLSTNNISFLINVLPQNMPNLYAQHNLFVLPANSEPLGYSLLEAMASGLPIITSNDVGSSCYVAHNKNGIVLREISQNTLYDAIMTFITKDNSINTNKLRNFGKQSLAITKKYHSLMQSKKSFIRLLNKN